MSEPLNENEIMLTNPLNSFSFFFGRCTVIMVIVVIMVLYFIDGVVELVQSIYKSILSTQQSTK